MESVFSGFVILFLILSTVLTVFGGGLSAQDKVQQKWQEAQARIDAQTRSSLSALRSEVTNSGQTIEITLTNDGITRLMEFDRWDAIIQYADDSDPSNYRVRYLPYVDSDLDDNECTVSGLYLDSLANFPEEFEPSIFNSDEEMIARLQLSPGLLPGTSAQVTFVAENGTSVTTFAHRNVPPVLAINTGTSVIAGGSVGITDTMLLTTDVDNSNDELEYRVITAPQFGTLTLGTTFTQDDINNGYLKYRHTVGEPDSFEFIITDGTDTIGPYIFNLTVNDPPTLDVNTGMTAGGVDPIPITAAMLSTSDADNAAGELTYTVTTSPTKGNLSASTFTQDDINSGAVTYTPTDTGPDAFHFTVSDGQNTIGPYTFDITS